ncbi:MAG: pyridoxamine 5'-phosphate oxidase [Ferruginibacter sp.]
MSAVADIRKEYRQKMLSEQDVAGDPFTQFDRWWADALASEIDEVNAMTLATAGADGRPSARIVLLKGYDVNGFVFFTNYNSHKALQVKENPFVSLCFFWKELERQVRIEGTIEKLPAADSDAYFQSRPAGSRIGAWASPQSNVIASRDEIENNVKKLEEKYASGNIERPPHWGGYLVKPVLVEFWQGRPSRLHDRIQYTIAEEGGWIIERLAP